MRGKRGVGFCKSMPGAVLPFQRTLKRRNLKPTDPVFPRTHHELFNTILDELGLKFDREDQRRAFYSLRHTYICLRLTEGGRRISNSQELPHQRQDDLRLPYQEHGGCVRDQRPAVPYTAHGQIRTVREKVENSTETQSGQRKITA